MSSHLKHRRSYSLFAYRPASGLKILFFVILSLVLMTVDHHYNSLEFARTGLSAVVYPLRLAASIPYTVSQDVMQEFSFHNTLRKRDTTLKRENLKLRARLQQLKTLERENTKLRALMNAAARTHGTLRIGKIMKVGLDPFRQQVVINLGTNDGAYIGQPVLGAQGIMGQITHVGPFTSIVLLITDPNAAIPVEVVRNGLRTIAIGTGSSNELSLPYLPNNANIRNGDLLVTSGLGGHFPRGYKVATVTQITKKPGEPFSSIKAQPTAELSRSHQVLLLWPPKTRHKPVSTPRSTGKTAGRS